MSTGAFTKPSHKYNEEVLLPTDATTDPDSEDSEKGELVIT